MEKFEKRWKQLENTRDPDKIICKYLGSRFKDYRMKWERASNLELIQDFPIHLDFELHYGCNLKCQQCILQMDRKELNPSHPYYITKKAGRISLTKFKEIIDEGVKHGLESITFTVNNEPLMLSNLTEYIRYANKRGIIDKIIITNGELLSRKLSKEIIKSGVTKLYFSIDAASEETYRKIRKNGNFKKVLNNVNAFHNLRKEMKKKLPVLRVSFVKSKLNEHEERQFINYWKNKVDFVSIQAFTTPALGISNEQKIKKDFHIHNSNLKTSGPCPQPYQRLTIYHDGSVHPCCHWYGATMILGNIFNDSVYDIWNSEKMKVLRRNINDKDSMPGECRVCRAAVFGEPT